MRRLPWALTMVLFLASPVRSQTVAQGIPGTRPWPVSFLTAQPVTVSGTVTVTFTMPSLVAGSALIGHVITDSGSTTAITGNVTVVQPTGANLHVAVDAAPTTAVTNSNLDLALSALRDAIVGAGPKTLTDVVAALTSLTVSVSGSVTTSPPANASTNITQVNGTTIDTNSGSKSAGTQRVVLATDQPALTNLLKVEGAYAPATGANPTNTVPAAAFLMGYDTVSAVWRRALISSNQVLYVECTVVGNSCAKASSQTDGSQKSQIVDGSGNVVGETSNALDINIKSGSIANTSFQATQASGANLHVNVDSAPTTAITAAALPLPANAAQETGGNLATLVTNSKSRGAASLPTMILATNLDTLLLASNASRVAWRVCNQSRSPLLLKFGSGATEFSYNVRVPPRGCYEDATYTGQVDGFWYANADNFAMVSESS